MQRAMHPNCVAKDKDEYRHELFTECKSFNVEPSENEQALPPVMQHAPAQTEAAPPVVDDTDPAHLTKVMINDAFRQGELGTTNCIIGSIENRMLGRQSVCLNTVSVLQCMLASTNLELIAEGRAKFVEISYMVHKYVNSHQRQGGTPESVVLNRTSISNVQHFSEQHLQQHRLRSIYSSDAF